MLLYIIRHGAPDYETDTLLETGKQQAELVAARLAASGIDQICSSPYGRAMETAAPLSRLLKLPVQIEEWAYELGKESDTIMPDGSLKIMSHFPGTEFHRMEWRTLSVDDSLDKIPLFPNTFRARYKEIANGLDGLLERNGYIRNEAGFYTVTAENDSHIALFCHLGMQRVMFSHLFHIPYQFLASTLQLHHTAVSVIYFPGKPEDRTDVMPVAYSIGDVGHLYAEGHPLTHYFSGIPF